MCMFTALQLYHLSWTCTSMNSLIDECIWGEAILYASRILCCHYVLDLRQLHHIWRIIDFDIFHAWMTFCSSYFNKSEVYMTKMTSLYPCNKVKEGYLRITGPSVCVSLCSGFVWIIFTRCSTFCNQRHVCGDWKLNLIFLTGRSLDDSE